jgi:hypothetical protein
MPINLIVDEIRLDRRIFADEYPIRSKYDRETVHAANDVCELTFSAPKGTYCIGDELRVEMEVIIHHGEEV